MNTYTTHVCVYIYKVGILHLKHHATISVGLRNKVKSIMVPVGLLFCMVGAFVLCGPTRKKLCQCVTEPASISRVMYVVSRIQFGSVFKPRRFFKVT